MTTNYILTQTVALLFVVSTSMIMPCDAAGSRLQQDSDVVRGLVQNSPSFPRGVVTGKGTTPFPSEAYLSDGRLQSRMLTANSPMWIKGWHGKRPGAALIAEWFKLFGSCKPACSKGGSSGSAAEAGYVYPLIAIDRDQALAYVHFQTETNGEVREFILLSATDGQWREVGSAVLSVS